MKQLKRLRFTFKVIVIAIVMMNGRLFAQTAPLNPNLINFNSDAGEKLFFTSDARQDYFPLSIQFVTQENLAYCGVASMVMVLNALSIPAPEAPEFRSYRVFTQDNFFANPKTSSVMTAETVTHQGITLEQISKLLETYPVTAKIYYGSDLTLEAFRQLIIDNLKNPQNFVLVNYLRKTIGQESGGHISPIAAYNEVTDRFLILDVARYKYPPVWVKVEDLWQATRTIDSTSEKTRGLVLIERK